MTDVIEQQIQFINGLIKNLKNQRNELIKLQRKEYLDVDMIELFLVIQSNPGIDRKGIMSLVKPNIDYNNKMTALVRKKKLINVGTRQQPSWYAIGDINT